MSRPADRTPSTSPPSDPKRFASFREIADFLWQNAERLRGQYKPHEHDKVISEGAIGLRDGETGVVYGPTDVGTKQGKDDEAPLSEIIQVLNERFRHGARRRRSSAHRSVRRRGTARR